MIDAISLLEHVERGMAPELGRVVARGRRRQYGHGRGAGRPPPRRRGGDPRLPPRPRPHARRTLRGRRGVPRRRQGEVADQPDRASARKASPSSASRSARTARSTRPANSRRCRSTRWCWRSASTPTSPSCENVSGIEIGRDDTIVVDERLMTGRPGHLRRRRRDRRHPHDDRGDRPRQEGGARHRCVAARRDLRGAGEASRSVEFGMLNLPLFLDAGQTQMSELPVEARQHLRRGGGRDQREAGALRGRPLPLLRQLLRMRQLLRRLPRTGDRQARQGPANTASISICAPAARSASTSAPAMPSRWSASRTTGARVGSLGEALAPHRFKLRP